MKRVAVIGGGAAGMMAAAMAAESGAAVTVYERNDRVGKKILATGNGKCNFSNRNFSAEDYYGNREKLERCFRQFSVEDTVRFFEAEGMLVKEKKGYLYPLSEQAATVLDVLRFRLQRLSVKTELQAKVEKITKKAGGEGFIVQADGRVTEWDSVILACGGMAAPKTGSDGSGYLLAESLGHHMVPAVPALVQLRCGNGFFQMTAGVRCEAGLKLYGEEKLIQEETGELQFTDYGISGIPVFQFSRQAAYLLKEGKKVSVYIDLLPEMSRQEFEEMCALRIGRAGDKTLEEFLLGMANKKINLLMIKLAGRKPQDAAQSAGANGLKRLLASYRELRVSVTETNSFEHAQVTAGGVDMREVTDSLESVKAPGLFFAGEILDVDGRCGGYNLQWAWTSGYIAGKNAAMET